MKIDIRHQGDATVVSPDGPRLDAEVAARFRTALLQAIDNGSTNLVVDLARIEFIDSSGLGALVSALKRLKEITPAADIRLAHVQDPVRAVLQIIRLHRIFTEFPSTAAAVESFGARV